MLRRRGWLASALCVLVASGCSAERTLADLDPTEREALADSVRESVREYFRAADSIPCERPDSLLTQTMTFDYGPQLYASDTTIMTVTRDEALELMRARECPSPVENARLVGAIQVQLLTRDHAVVSWKFDEDMREADGRRQRIQGVVLETKVRTPAGWRTTSGMGSHVKLGEPRALPN